MPDLNFAVDRAEVDAYAASPTLTFKLRIEDAEQTAAIRSVMLRCQIRIEPARRKYSSSEQEHLLDLFGEPPRWSQTLHSMLWTHASVVVPPFSGAVAVDLSIPCSSDFNIAASKYFYGMEDGHAPLLLLFSGTVFYAGADGAMQVQQISWEKETTFKLPVSTWKQMMDQHYPNTAWLYLRKDVFDRLYLFKSRHALTTWEQAVELLLRHAEAGVTP